MHSTFESARKPQEILKAGRDTLACHYDSTRVWIGQKTTRRPLTATNSPTAKSDQPIGSVSQRSLHLGRAGLIGGSGSDEYDLMPNWNRSIPGKYYLAWIEKMLIWISYPVTWLPYRKVRDVRDGYGLDRQIGPVSGVLTGVGATPSGVTVSVRLTTPSAYTRLETNAMAIPMDAARSKQA